MKGKHIVLGVTGGIAAYKTALLVRECVKAGAEVQVVMTRHAAKFVAPLTFSTLSRREVITEMFPADPDNAAKVSTKHIDLALWADVMLIAPATANTIAKIVHGAADDFLTTLVLALRCPLAVAPAMDVDMYQNEVTTANIAALREIGCHVIDPESGELASGLVGPGRLPETENLLKFLDGILAGAHKDLVKKKVLVTAGPTHEAIDPVRYIGNHSSGKMGFAIANAASQRGADVTLVSGPVALKTPRGVRRVDVRTAIEMQKAVDAEFDRADIVVMSAAVADFAPVTASDSKIKRERTAGEGITIELKRNPDILQSLGKKKKKQVLVGFALETDNAVENAREKLSKKNLDMVVLNDLKEEGAGFGTDTNVVTMINADGSSKRFPKMSKFDVANAILDRALALR